MTANNANSTSIRKVMNDDPKLRPFLSSHFDSQTYIKSVIKDGRSEECFNNVATCIEEVNEEIKGYKLMILVYYCHYYC